MDAHELRGTLDFGRDVHRVEDYGHGGCSFVNMAGRFETVHARHGQVENDGIGTQRGSFGDRLVTIFGVAANFPALMAFQEAAQALALEFVVVGNQDSYGHSCGCAHPLRPNGVNAGDFHAWCIEILLNSVSRNKGKALEWGGLLCSQKAARFLLLCVAVPVGPFLSR